MQFKGANETLMEGRIAEEGQDIFEEDAGFRKVWKLTQCLVQSYLKTGEFGGGGGQIGPSSS